MSLSNEQTLTLIDMYRDRPILWDATLMEYRNKNKRHDMLMEIAVVLEIEKGDVEKKIKNLQTTFARERKKVKDSQKTGSGYEETYVSKWFAYQDMMFLADKNKPRTTVDTEELEEKNETVEQNEEVKENKEVNENESINEEQDVNQDKQDEVTTNANSNKKPHKEFQSPKKPMPTKRKYGSHSATSTPVMNEALNLMRSIQSNKAEKDEYSLFGEQVAVKLRKINSPRARFTVQNIINQALFDGEMGMYSHNTPAHANYRNTYSYTPSAHFGPHFPQYEYNNNPHTTSTPLSSPSFSASQSPVPTQGFPSVSPGLDRSPSVSDIDDILSL